MFQHLNGLTAQLPMFQESRHINRFSFIRKGIQVNDLSSGGALLYYPRVLTELARKLLYYNADLPPKRL